MFNGLQKIHNLFIWL